jgi:predicted alpha/beta superfamily hydrolase
LFVTPSRVTLFGAAPLLAAAALLFSACSDGPSDPGSPSTDGGAGDLATTPTTPDDGGAPAPPDFADAPTTIRVHYPAGARALALRGDAAPLSWSAGVPLTPVAGEPNTYAFTFARLERPVEVKPLLDDTTWSRGNNYVVRPGETVDLYPHFTTTRGRVVELFASFSSTILGNSRRVWAYLPPSYDENPTARYPVLYMHDGQNLFDASRAAFGTEWGVDETLDAAADGDGLGERVREIIVVAPENAGAARIDEYTPSYDRSERAGGRGGLYLRFLVEELKPRVDAMLRTHPEREATGVMGSSLGGLISAYAALWHADTFGLIGEMSPSTWWNDAALVDDVTAAANATPRPVRIYVDCGQPGDDYANTKDLVAAYQATGWVEGQTFLHVYAPNAQHTESAWAKRLPAALRFLFGGRIP